MQGTRFGSGMCWVAGVLNPGCVDGLPASLEIPVRECKILGDNAFYLGL